jgi:hypothetical protein
MNATQSKQLPARLTVVFTLSRLLQRLEQSQEPVGADQYKAIVARLSDELSNVEMDDSLRLLLNAHPAAAELYENLNYQHAGLCRSPLEASMQAELMAKDVIARAAQHAPAAGQGE